MLYKNWYIHIKDDSDREILAREGSAEKMIIALIIIGLLIIGYVAVALDISFWLVLLFLIVLVVILGAAYMKIESAKGEKVANTFMKVAVIVVVVIVGILALMGLMDGCNDPVSSDDDDYVDYDDPAVYDYGDDYYYDRGEGKVKKKLW